MAPVQSKHSLSGRHDEPTTPSRKKYKTPISSSSDFKLHHPTAPASVCNLTPSQTARITQPFHHSLIAWIVGKNIHPQRLAFRLHSHLRLSGDLDVIQLGLGFFVLKFSNSSDYFKALEERPWSITHLCIHVFPWIPNFKPSEALIPFVDVWIRLPELSIEYYDKEVFETIAKAIGVCLVKIDPVTERREKCMFARICIRITLCNPLIYSIQFERIQQKIEYEGLDYLCPACGCVYDLKHDCLNQNNPSGSSGFDPHQHKPRPLQVIDPSSGSKKPLIHSLPSSESGLGSESHEKDCPRIQMGECKPQVLVKAKVVENEKKTLPNFPKESSTTTMKALESKHTHLIQSVPLATSVVVHQVEAAKASSSTELAVHNNESQSPSAVEAHLEFYSTVIKQSTAEKEMINTPSGGVNVDGCPTVYKIDPKTTSLQIDLSEVPTATGSNQTQYATNFVLPSRGENENGDDSEGVSIPALCSKKMLCWNFRGTDNAKLIRASKDLIQLHEPSLVLIFGSNISSADADHVVRELALDGSYCRKPDGCSGGVWILFSRQDVQIEFSSYSPQKVSASVHFHSKPDEPVAGLLDEDTETSPRPWGPTFFYASTRLMDNTMAYSYSWEKVKKH